MQRFAKLAAGLFGRRREPAGGLSASLEELMEQRKIWPGCTRKANCNPPIWRAKSGPLSKAEALKWRRSANIPSATTYATSTGG